MRTAWAITIGEALLLVGLAVVLYQYWWMLPVWLRNLGALGLLGLAAAAILRLIWFSRRHAHRPANGSGTKPVPPASPR